MRHKRGGMFKMRQNSVKMSCVWDGEYSNNKEYTHIYINETERMLKCSKYVFETEYKGI